MGSEKDLNGNLSVLSNEDNLDGQIGRIEDELAKAQETLTSLQKLKTELEVKKKENVEKAKQENESITTLQNENAKLKDELKSYQAEIASFKQLILSLKTDLVSKLEAVENVEGQIHNEKTDKKPSEEAPAKPKEEEKKSVSDVLISTISNTEKSNVPEEEQPKEENKKEETEKVNTEVEASANHLEEVKDAAPAEEKPTEEAEEKAEPATTEEQTPDNTEEETKPTETESVESGETETKKENKEEEQAKTNEETEETKKEQLVGEYADEDFDEIEKELNELKQNIEKKNTASTNELKKEDEDKKEESEKEETDKSRNEKENTEENKGEQETESKKEKQKKLDFSKIVKNFGVILLKLLSPLVSLFKKLFTGKKSLFSYFKKKERKQEEKKTQEIIPRKIREERDAKDPVGKLIKFASFVILVALGATAWRVTKAENLRDMHIDMVRNVQEKSKQPENQPDDPLKKKENADIPSDISAPYEEKYKAAFNELPFEQTQWTDHNDSMLGVKIKYPSNTAGRAYQVGRNNLWIVRKYGYLFKIEKLTTPYSLDQFFDVNKIASEHTKEATTFKNMQAVKIVLKNVPVKGDYIYAQYDSTTIYKIWYATYEPGENPDDQKRVQYMLDSLEFYEKVEE